MLTTGKNHKIDIIEIAILYISDGGSFEGGIKRYFVIIKKLENYYHGVILK